MPDRRKNSSMHPERNRDRLRRVAALLIALTALAPVVLSSYRGARMSLGFVDGSSREAGARQERRWQCVEREIAEALPEGARVTIPMDQPLLPYQRAMELVAPHAEVVSQASQAEYELRLIRSPRGGTCWNFRVDATRIR